MHYKVINQLKERRFDHKCSKSETAVLDYLEENFKKIPSFTVVKVALESYTSQATVNRTCKLLGFSGFSSLKYAIEEDLKLMLDHSYSHIMDTEYVVSRINFETSINFVQHILKSREKLLVFGLGASKISAQYLQRQLLYVGVPSIDISEIQMLKQFQNHTILILSNSGETQRCLQIIAEAKKVNMDVLSITKKDSPVMQQSDITFYHDVAVDKMEGISREQQLHMIVMVHEIIKQIQDSN